MEIKRDFLKQLDEWKNRKDRCPILVRGARQVGKSYAVRAWANKNFPNQFLEINFEQNERFKEAFQDNLSPDEIILKLQILTNKTIQKENFLLFFDEIQLCPRAIKAFRYFYEQMPELYVIGAGSLLDFILSDISFPVGRVESLYMFPCTFYEFLSANKQETLRTYLENHDLESKIDASIHKIAIEQLMLYYRVGGMPRIVSDFCDNVDLKNTSRLQFTLLQSYIDDFAKYSKENVWKVLNTVFENIPQYVAGDRIKFSRLCNGERAEKVKYTLSLLEKAHLLHLVFHSDSTQLPLVSDIQRGIFKLLFFDIGLWQALHRFDWTSFSFNADLTDIFDGKFAEQFIGQEIIAKKSTFRKYALHYWKRTQKSSQAEIDYLIEYQNKVIPLEIKSAVSGRLRSLHLYLDEKSVSEAFLFSQRNIEVIYDEKKQQKIKLLPLYLIGNKNI